MPQQPLEFEYTAPPLDENTAAAALLGKRDVSELADLVRLRRKGWSEEGLDGHFKQQRRVVDKPTHSSEVYWFKMMKEGMKEIDDATSVLPTHYVKFEFLDLCCAPGGFSSFTLGKLPLARGVGISLPVSSGGHKYMLEKHLRSRYQFIEKDILEYDLSPHVPFNSSNRFPESMLQRFQLVIVDGHALRTYTAPDWQAPLDDPKATHLAYRDCLLITQLIIALETVCPGGTVMMKLSHIESFPATHILYLLDKLSDELVVHKPRSMHAVRGTFYVVAKGVCHRATRAEELKALYLAGLKQLWSELTGRGPSGRARMAGDDLDFIVTGDGILGEYLDRLIGLGRGVWETQLVALRGLFAKKGIL